ncbi:coiled-coil domain-containing protein 84 [Microcaecilia unicolor]|uniref:Coiled-coil domain-containing protein 84-like n=1 Tax=Microcaecilia unicolor TaxID=1415580 RepID=A0A6P7ZR18_9AMPH|nr:coiled-coil domain-containing protein 84-like [Microcaecilia unicolor]
MGVFYCQICRQTFFSGKSHSYEKKHQQRLKAVLGTYLKKVEAACKMINSAEVVKYNFIEHEQNIWCYCCQVEVKKHMSNGNLTVIYGGLLEHLASPEHRKETNKFWWENKADVKLKQRFLVLSEDYERFKLSVTTALENYEEMEDVHIKEVAAHIRKVEQSRLEMVQGILEPQSEIEDSERPSASGVPVNSGSGLTFDAEPEDPWAADVHVAPELDWMEAGQSLTFIGHQEPSVNGNVHSGATPPWLMQDDAEATESRLQEIGPSFEEFQKQQEKEKLRKLPPNRVGANFDHSSQTDEGWLPSFGRVWNNGRRWQSRHQFRRENDEKRAVRRKGGKYWKKGKKSRMDDLP